MTTDLEFAEIPFQGRTIRLEHRWIAGDRHAAPLIVFLHEGLGSVAMWKDYPQRLCDAGGFRGLVYSRYGYGRSTPRPPQERWPIDYLHREAHETLPVFLHAVGAEGERPWLLGHSDGASIALIYAASFPDALSGAVVMAPHIFVEAMSLDGIAQTKASYESGDLRQRLAAYHQDPDSAFWGWCDAWLDPVFRTWSIEALLPAIRCPLLAVQGYEDEYATMAHLDGIKRHVPQTELLKLARCRHSPHRDQPAALTQAVVAFIRGAEEKRQQAAGG
ncbi:MAG: alpha/beta fold hydrolase [Pseudomonadota bacterium]